MTRTHEIKLDGYGAHTTLADDRPIMLLGTAESYGIEMLHIVPGKDWAELTITATFNAADGSSTDILMDTDGNVVVPSEATAKSGSGRIVFAGVSNGIQRISCDLDYFVVAHSAINGAQSGGVAPSWFEQAATRFLPKGGTSGQVLVKKTDADFETEWKEVEGVSGTTDHSQLINRDIADQHPISAITGLEEALTPLTGTTETLTPTQVYDAIKSGKSVLLQHTHSLLGLFTFASFNIFEGEKVVVSTSTVKNGNEYLVDSLVGFAGSNEWVFNITEMAKADDIPVAVNEALAQAKASGEFDGAAGKSAYAYAQDGGYTGTEEQFAAKLAKEKFANPYALTFTGAVTSSYDGSEAVTVNIPSGGSGGSIATATKLHEITLVEEVTSIIETLPFNPMDYKKIIVLCSAVSTTTNTSKFSVRVSLGGLQQWLPNWLNHNAVQKFHARFDYDIQSGLNMLTVYYSNNYTALGDTPLNFNYPRYNYTLNDLTNTFKVETQNKYLGVGTKFEIWGIK